MDPKELRARTRPEHEATEALLPLGHEDLTLAEYRAGLLALAPVVTGWERWADAHAPEELRGLVRAHRREALLRADLVRLGADVAPLGAEVDGPGRGPAVVVDWAGVVTGGEPGGEEAEGGVAGEGVAGRGEAGYLAGFVGALYVMEGSTLGGRWLARHASAVLGPAVEGATGYFNGYGERTGAMWREVTAEIEKVPEALAERTVGAAKRCFAAFAGALRAAGGEPRENG